MSDNNESLSNEQIADAVASLHEIAGNKYVNAAARHRMAKVLIRVIESPASVPEDVARDAARYRHFRDNDDGFGCYMGESLDNAIDAAMLAAAPAAPASDKKAGE